MKEKKINSVFIISLILSIAVCVWAIVFDESFKVASDSILNFLKNDFGWLYMAAMLTFVFFALFIAFSKWGDIKLGPDDSNPEYKTLTWFAMLFGCGMGVGLVFWGVAEPISHFISPMAGIEKATADASDFAFKSSFMHWGVHPWAGYSIIGLALAYFQFKKNKKGLLSTTLEPLYGDKKWIGTLTDILAVFATVAGIVTSLGLGIIQIGSGLNYLFNFPNNLTTQIILIIIISVIFIWTAVSGIDKGIAFISNLNLYIAFTVMGLLFILGPRVDMLTNMFTGLGNYLNNIISDSLSISMYNDHSWVLNWRIFYWAWWIAWAPFVGIFIARISKGRTIREFILGVVLVPAVASVLWFAIFGTLGIKLGIDGVLTQEQLSAIAASPETGLFVVLQKYPLGQIISVISIVLLMTFFITSANSGTFVLSMLSSEGSLNPPKSRILVWGIILSIMSIGMLIAGGLKPLQTVSIVAAFPFIFIMIAVMVSLIKELKKEK